MLNPGIAFEIEISECTISNSPVPKWLRQRLEENLENKAKSLEDIETRLKEADLRRQVVIPYNFLQLKAHWMSTEKYLPPDGTLMNLTNHGYVVLCTDSVECHNCSNFMNGWRTRHDQSQE